MLGHTSGAPQTNLKSSPGEDFAGIPLDVLRSRLRKHRSSIKLRDDQIEALLREADKNGDERITVEEFEELVTSTKAQSSQVKRALYLIADQVITPQQRIEVHSYIDEYSCYPPPLFILFITLVEIAVFFHYYYTESIPPNEDIFTFCAGCYVDNHIGPLLFAPKLRAQVWRFLTYALLHAGLNWAEMPYRWVRLTLISIFLTFDIGSAIIPSHLFRRMRDGNFFRLTFGQHRRHGYAPVLFRCGHSLQYCGM
ncbi:EF hand [Ostertagia ostertagi]